MVAQEGKSNEAMTLSFLKVIPPPGKELSVFYESRSKKLIKAPSPTPNVGWSWYVGSPSYKGNSAVTSNGLLLKRERERRRRRRKKWKGRKIKRN